ncbi:MAG: elongation factor G [Nitriliruptorales bacterium]|nr:elongation factor G [Nitriliruptorales bacterium]
MATEKVRNVLVLGHTATGKSTLVESMLAVAGHPAHGEGCPTVDHDPEEIDRGHSLGLALAAFEFDGHLINVLDAPGGAEAIGDAYPALVAADIALFVVDASMGLQPQHVELWAECEKLGLPRMVFLNKLDLERAQYQTNIDQLREAYGKPVAPVHMPLGIHEEFDGVIDLLHGIAVEFQDGKRIEEDIPEERREQAERNREFLVEAVVEHDDELLERYLEGDVPDTLEIARLFATGIAEAGFFPVLCGSAKEGIGTELLLHFLVEEGPSAPESWTQGDTSAVVFKTLSDQYLGHINLLRILGGPLRVDDSLTSTRTGDTHRLHQLFSLRGKEQLPVTNVAPGGIVAVAKLDNVKTGDILTSGTALEISLPEPPEGHHRVLLEPDTMADDSKLSTALRDILEEDPSITEHRDEESHVTTLAFLGPTHVDVTIARLKRKHGVSVTAQPAPIAFRETIRGQATGLGRHVKQSGGHGQYGVATIEVSPLPRGGGFEFEDAIVGGVIPNQYIPSVEKGIIEAMTKGPLGGNPMVDVKVRLVDGKQHSVDSSDAAFQMAGILAFRDACEKLDVVLLEPIMEIDIAVPDDLTGAVMSDLSSRRGRILGTDVAGSGRTMVHAEVPEVELRTFAAEFRALTSGQGQVAMRYVRHDEVPAGIAKRLLPET